MKSLKSCTRSANSACNEMWFIDLYEHWMNLDSQRSPHYKQLIVMLPSPYVADAFASVWICWFLSACVPFLSVPGLFCFSTEPWTRETDCTIFTKTECKRWCRLHNERYTNTTQPENNTTNVKHVSKMTTNQENISPKLMKSLWNKSSFDQSAFRCFSIKWSEEIKPQVRWLMNENQVKQWGRLLVLNCLSSRPSQVLEAWKNLLEAAEGRRVKLVDTGDKFRFFSMVRDLMLWMEDVIRLIEAQENPRWGPRVILKSAGINGQRLIPHKEWRH